MKGHVRYAILCLSVAAATFFHVSWALAFSGREAVTVVEILEVLAPLRGEAVYYDDDAAADWYEFDQEEGGLIASAGFSPERWRSAYDNALKGMMALIPQAEFDAAYGDLDEKAAAIAGLNEEQRRELANDLRAIVRQARALRAEGAAHADAVRPVAARLRKLADF